jgi:hypothetical protein
MKTNFSSSDHLFRKAVNNDHPNIEPDAAIAERLNYYYSLKQPGRKLHANSFSGMIVWLLSVKSMGLKAGFVSLGLAYFLFLGNIKSSSEIPGASDTCQIHSLLVDSSYVAKDTCK